MLPYQSPIKSFQVTASGNEVDSPSKINKIPISLHGLFGETNSLDDSISLPFVVQSPPCGSSIKKSPSSPSKSSSSIVTGHHQPVLLSELTDVSLLEEQIKGIYHKNTICSFVSPYDNRRCTNSANVKRGLGKSYCSKHLYLTSPSSEFRDLQTKKTDKFSNKVTTQSSCVTKLSYQTLDDNESPSITLNSLNDIPYFNSSISRAGIDLSDSGYQTQHVDPRNEGKIVKIKNQQAAMNQTSSTAGLCSYQNNFSNPTISVTPKVLSRPKHPAMAMDGDVLQAVVDLLNQNHDKLTSKQQIELLNSLGVTVATIQSPLHNSSDATCRTTYCNQNTKPSNLSNQSSAVCHKPTKMLPVNHVPSSTTRQNTASVLKTLNSKENDTQSSLVKAETGVKRPTSEIVENVQSKKRKKNETSSTNFLRGLSSVELDKQVSKALASIRHSVSTKKKSESKLKKESVSQTKSVKLAKVKPTPMQAVLPSVSIPMNPMFTSDKFKVRCPQLQEYVDLQNEKHLRQKSLFPDLFHEERNISFCTCKKSYKRDIQKLKQKTQKSLIKHKQLCKCKCGSAKMSKVIRKLKSSLKSGNFEASADFWMLSTLNLYNESATNTDEINEKHSKHIRFYCEKLDTATKHWQKLLKEEKKSIQLLTQSMQSDVNETASVLRKLGTKPVSCSRRRGICSKKPDTCALSDRNGDTCPNTALPLSPYCHNHIWHSEHQLLYKLDQGMKVVADINPDPVVIRPRKKTKLPPLSKRKKRRNKRGKAKNGAFNNKVKEEMELVNIDDNNTGDGYHAEKLKMNLANVKYNVSSKSTAHCSKYNHHQDTVDKIDVDGLTNEDSTSGMFDSLLDESQLLDDEMFKGFGHSSEVLDNALMLASAVHSDNAGKLNIDRLPFDDLNESNVFFSSNHEVDDILSTRGDLDNIYMQNNLDSPSVQTQEEPELLNSMFLTPTTSEIYSESKWSTPQFTSTADVDLGDVSSSLDSSFADDLHELEGVIRSLQDETDNHIPTTRSNRMHTMNADEYTSILAKEISQEIENQSFDYNTSQSTTSNMENCTESSKSLPFETICCAGDTRCSSHNVTSSKPTSIMTSQLIALDNTKFKLSAQPMKVLPHTQQLNTKAKQKNTKQTIKRSKLKTTRKQNMVKQETSTSCTKQSSSVNSSVAVLTHVQSAVKSKIDKQRAIGKKIRYNQAVHSNIIPVAQPVVALTPTVRVQPHIMPSNVVCTTGKLSNNNQSMVLIPVNAYVRPGNNMSQSMGLAFAVPAHNLTSNVGTVIPIRNSTVMTGACPQQLIILNGSQAGIATCANMAPSKQTINTTVYPPNVTNTIITQQSSVKKPTTTTTQSKSILLKNNQTRNMNVSSPVTTSNRNYQINNNQLQSITLTSPTNNTLVFSSNDLTMTNATSTNQVTSTSVSTCSSTIMINTSNQSRIQTLVDEHDKLKQIVEQLNRPNLTPTITSTVKNTNRARNSSLVIPPVLSGSSGTLMFSPSSKHKGLPILKEDTIPTTSSPTISGNHSAPTGSKSGTVHWNQSSAGPDVPPPIPQNSVYSGVGGQTSNMLFCRRISPSLNNTQHVVVGRLGSLGRLGLPRLTVSDIHDRNIHIPSHRSLSENARNSNQSEKPTAYIQLTKDPSLATLEKSVELNTTDSAVTMQDTTTVATTLPENSVTDHKPLIRHNTRKCEHTVTLVDPNLISPPKQPVMVASNSSITNL
nr:uncharacterized protein LOC100181186 isoform X2 [Ciona intestinalis]|eukprot:XP_002120342.1 uncharacterized protein LOC100181186 isoform X2 [Ciona intestinalis]